MLIHLVIVLQQNFWFPTTTMLLFIAMVSFGLTSSTSPGALRGSSPVPFIKLVEKFDPNLLCP